MKDVTVLWEVHDHPVLVSFHYCTDEEFHHKMQYTILRCGNATHFKKKKIVKN